MPWKPRNSCDSICFWSSPYCSGSGTNFSTLCLWIWLFSAPHVSGITQRLSTCDWPSSPSTVSLRFIQVVACVRISLLFEAESHPSCGWTTFCLSIHASMDTWVCFHLLAIVDSITAVNVGVEISAGVPALSSFACIPRSCWDCWSKGWFHVCFTVQNVLSCTTCSHLVFTAALWGKH